MGKEAHFTRSMLERLESLLGGDSESMVLEDFGGLCVVTRLIVKSRGVGLLAVGLTRNLQCLRQKTKPQVMYLDTIMEEGGQSEGAFNNTI